jgi:hypothetical protein
MWLWGEPYIRNSSDVGKRRRRIQNPGGGSIQIGRDAGWKQVVRRGGVYFSLKEDGSLWVWGDGERQRFGQGLTEATLVPERVPVDTPVAELILEPWGNSLVVRPVHGDALVFGGWLQTVQTDRLPDPSTLTAIRMPFVSNEPSPYFEDRRLFLTDEGIVLDHTSPGQFGGARYVGNNWIAVTHHFGFTRDGSLWRLGDFLGEREPSVGSRLTRWLNLNYAQGEQHLIPRRWRMELVELKP